MGTPMPCDRQRSERGTILVVALMVMVLLFLLGTTLLGVSGDEKIIAANDEWAESTFFAAEAATQEAMNQITDANVDSPPGVALTTINQKYTFRTGRRTDTSSQPPTFVGKSTRPGFSVGASSGYSPSPRFWFYTYTVNGTGFGPRGTTREVEVQLEYGPVSR